MRTLRSGFDSRSVHSPHHLDDEQKIWCIIIRFAVWEALTERPIPGKTIGLAFFVPGMCTFLGKIFQKISLGYVSFLVPQTFYIMVGRWLVLQTLCGSDGLTRPMV